MDIEHDELMYNLEVKNILFMYKEKFRLIPHRAVWADNLELINNINSVPHLFKSKCNTCGQVRNNASIRVLNHAKCLCQTKPVYK
nr:Mediator complex subunit 27 [Moritella viscosa]